MKFLCYHFNTYRSDPMAVFEGNEGPNDHYNDHPYPSIKDEDTERGIV